MYIFFSFFFISREGRLDVFYYSSKKHVDELIKALDDQDEFNLVSAIRERYEDIMKHMKITEELYFEKKGKYFKFYVSKLSQFNVSSQNLFEMIGCRLPSFRS